MCVCVCADVYDVYDTATMSQRCGINVLLTVLQRCSAVAALLRYCFMLTSLVTGLMKTQDWAAIQMTAYGVKSWSSVTEQDEVFTAAVVHLYLLGLSPQYDTDGFRQLRESYMPHTNRGLAPHRPPSPPPVHREGRRSPTPRRKKRKQPEVSGGSHKNRSVSQRRKSKKRKSVAPARTDERVVEPEAVEAEVSEEQAEAVEAEVSEEQAEAVEAEAVEAEEEAAPTTSEPKKDADEQPENADEQPEKSIPAEEEKEEESEEEKEEEGEEEQEEEGEAEQEAEEQGQKSIPADKEPVRKETTPWVPESRQESPPRQRAAGLQRPSRRVRGPPIPGTWGAPAPGSEEHVLKATGQWKHGNLRRNRGIGNAPQKNNIRSNTGNTRINTRSSGRR